MRAVLRHPVVLLPALALGSATLGTFAEGPGYGTAPDLGIYMVLTGAWFGLVVGFGVWNWGGRSLLAAMMSCLATWVAWEVAVNLALQLEENWLKGGVLPGSATIYVSGFAAGAAGAFATWAGAAAFAPVLRRVWIAVGVAAAGAAFGLLLPFTNHYDNAAVLLLPWQIAVAAALGIGLRPPSREAASNPPAFTRGPLPDPS